MPSRGCRVPPEGRGWGPAKSPYDVLSKPALPDSNGVAADAALGGDYPNRFSRAVAASPSRLDRINTADRGERDADSRQVERLKLSKWAEEYERGQGKIRCPQRERNNARRGQGKRVQDRVSRPTGRHRREEMSPQREQREAIPAGRSGSGWPGSGQRSAGSGSSFRGGVARRSGNWRNGASGSGRRFTGVTSGSGNIWRKIAEG